MKHQQAMKEIERLKEEHRKQINKTIESTQKERAKMQAEHEENVGKLTTQVRCISIFCNSIFCNSIFL